MKTLIIYAHPDVNGHCSLILDNVQKTLESKKTDYELIDLYKIKYDPVLKENELYTSKRYNISKDNLDFQKKINNANKLIFIYPIWWNSMPAILKGFFDRVFTPGFSFRYKNKLPIGLLKEKKAIVFITTSAPTIWSKIVLKNRAKNLIKKNILGFVGIKCKVYQLGSALELNKKQEKKIKIMVEKGMNNLMER